MFKALFMKYVNLITLKNGPIFTNKCLTFCRINNILNVDLYCLKFLSNFLKMLLINKDNHYILWLILFFLN